MKKIFILITIFGSLQAQNSALNQFSNHFADIAEKANPAVVTVLTEKNVDIAVQPNRQPGPWQQAASSLIFPISISLRICAPIP